MKKIIILALFLISILVGCNSPTEPNSGPIITDIQFHYQFIPDVGYSCETWMDVSRDCDYSINYWVGDVWYWTHQGSVSGPTRIYFGQLSANWDDTGKSWRILWTAGDESRELTGIFQEN